jgi:hypothetical protein
MNNVFQVSSAVCSPVEGMPSSKVPFMMLIGAA